MIGDFYRKLFESFKEAGYSRYVGEIRGLILQSLTGKEFHLDLLPEEYIPTNLTRGKYFCAELKSHLQSINKTGVPYRNFARDPVEVIQIKKMLNALYHSQMALEALESLDLTVKNGSKDIRTLLWGSTEYNSIIEHSYQASALFTQLDPTFLSVFTPELHSLYDLAMLLKNKSDTLSEDAEEKIEKFRSYFTSYQAGRLTGIGIGQLSSNSHKIDFNFLTNAFAKTPEYIDQLTQLIRRLSGELSDAEPHIKAKEIELLQEGAIHILEGLDDLYNSSKITMPFKVLRYIRMLRQIITVSKSIVDQVNYANESTQEALASKMVYLKYDLIQNLFELTDKIEDYGSFKPGLISRPLMQQMEKMYGAISFYVGKVVDFSEHGDDLAQLNENIFKQRRLAAINGRIEELQTKRLQWDDTMAAFTRFYDIIDAHPYDPIKDMPKEALEELSNAYRLIQHIMKKHDPCMHQKMVAALFPQHSQSKPGWFDWAQGNLYSWVGKGYDIKNWLQTIKTDLETILASQKASLFFRIQVATSLAGDISDQAVALHSYRKTFTIYSVNEKALVEVSDGLHTKNIHGSLTLCSGDLLDASEAISPEKADKVRLSYESKRRTLQDALKAYQNFASLAGKQPSRLWSSKTKHQLLKCYTIFQPWLYAQNNKNAGSIDRAVLAVLTPGYPLLESGTVKLHFANLVPRFESALQRYDRFYQQRIKFWNDYAKRKRTEIHRNIAILPSEPGGPRAGYVMARGDISTMIGEYRASLLNMRRLLTPAMQDMLVIQTSKAKSFHLTSVAGVAWPTYSTQSVLPYPEMEETYSAYVQPQQVAAIKHLYNGFYHLEGIVAQLEKLHNNSSKVVYVSHLLLCYSHIKGMKELLQGLYEDPYSRLLARQFMDKISRIYARLKPEIECYQVASEEITEIDAVVEKEAFWHVMQAFNLLPDHIRAKKLGAHPSAASQHKQRVQAKINVTDIERIIDSTDAYFKLFLESPTMIRLFFDLQHRMGKLTKTLHDVTIENLHNIDAEVFFLMLREADEWERKMGLRPGLLSEPLDDILDKFYLGMVEALNLSSELESSLLFNCERIIKRKGHIANQLMIKHSSVRKTLSYEKDIQRLYSAVQFYGKHYLNGLLSSQGIDRETASEIRRLFLKHASKLQEARTLLTYKEAMLTLNEALEAYTSGVAKKQSLVQGLRNCIVNKDVSIEIDGLLTKFSSSEKEKEQLEKLLLDYAKNPSTQKALRLYMQKHQLLSGEGLLEFKRLTQLYGQTVFRSEKLEAALNDCVKDTVSDIELALLVGSALKDTEQEQRIEQGMQRLCASEIERAQLENVFLEYAQDSDDRSILDRYMEQNDIYGEKAKVFVELAAMYALRINRKTTFEILLNKYKKNDALMHDSKASISTILTENNEQLQLCVAQLRAKSTSLSYQNTYEDRATQTALNAILAEQGKPTIAVDAADDTLYLSTCIRYLCAEYAQEVPLFFIEESGLAQKVLNRLLPEYTSNSDEDHLPSSADIAALLRYLNANFEKRAVSAQLETTILQEQFNYCVGREESLNAAKAAHREKYINQNFETIVKRLAMRYVGLDKSINAEYQCGLKRYLGEEKSIICDKVREAKDIRKALNIAINSHCQAYAKKQYKEYAHLQAFLATLASIDKYCVNEWQAVWTNSSVFENANTLAAKQTLVGELKAMATDTNLSIAKRIEGLQDKVMRYATSSTLQDSVVHKDTGWLWFKQWCYFLLSVIGLYTPSAKENYQQILQVAQSQTQAYKLPPKETFFSAKESPNSIQESLISLGKAAPSA